MSDEIHTPKAQNAAHNLLQGFAKTLTTPGFQAEALQQLAVRHTSEARSCARLIDEQLQTEIRRDPQCASFYVPCTPMEPGVVAQVIRLFGMAGWDVTASLEVDHEAKKGLHILTFKAKPTRTERS